jgi:hypothetical protein
MTKNVKGKEGGGKRGSSDTGQVRRISTLTGTQRRHANVDPSQGVVPDRKDKKKVKKR